ncbi:GNAT family N-acetyltransferase [Aeromicrobium sp. YIM 150415]|uniref:GNAT family N-acetyltransferase n=1 Tax=Aeromicrobium sp. YIM 150415 TaxID=2803912 RepID=UPI0019634904|nr:GNAT family N-acetyltransferase [Aeromicrobium sp. YIM 150415]MBM9465407.1 GNAT family N-acetyltransferase [Aeromicrobium sp. YIM 150415]
MTADDRDAVTRFLHEADLTLSGLDSPSLRLWIDRRDDEIVGCTGYELSEDRAHVLVRSVAVSPVARRTGRGRELARFALDQAAGDGARTAWLFSRRSGLFWESLGFAHADRDELATVLAGTHQVRLFRRTGQLEREIAWSCSLADHTD